MSRGGHNPKHGVNPQAAALQDHLAQVLRHVADCAPEDVALCRYEEHRSSDWRLSEHPWQCGVCHPPAHPSLVGERR
jgi:hypothetical protein